MKHSVSFIRGVVARLASITRPGFFVNSRDGLQGFGSGGSSGGGGTVVADGTIDDSSDTQSGLNYIMGWL